MKLAFALMAAINGSTGSWATLSSGLSLPHHASPASPRRHRRFSSFRGGGASAARDAVLKYARDFFPSEVAGGGPVQLGSQVRDRTSSRPP